MKVYLGRSSFNLAAEIIAWYGEVVCERIATYQIRKLAFKASSKNAAQIAFWAGVLARSRAIVLAEGEAERLRMTSEHVADLIRLERRSRPQHVQPEPRKDLPCVHP